MHSYLIYRISIIVYFWSNKLNNVRDRSTDSCGELRQTAATKYSIGIRGCCSRLTNCARLRGYRCEQPIRPTDCWLTVSTLNHQLCVWGFWLWADRQLRCTLKFICCLAPGNACASLMRSLSLSLFQRTAVMRSLRHLWLSQSQLVTLFACVLSCLFMFVSRFSRCRLTQRFMQLLLLCVLEFKRDDWLASSVSL